MLAYDQSFDLYMYYILIPLIVEEQMKRALGCGFVFNTTDRVIDKNSYSLLGAKPESPAAPPANEYGLSKIWFIST